jgi:uncharacterized delta-60 repeat protein
MAQVISLYGVQTLQPTTDNNFSLIVNTNTRGENTNEVRLLVDTSAQVVPSSINIYLPTILSYNGFWTTQIYIVDISGTANARPIEIYATGGDTIDGSPMVSINNSYGNAVVLVANAGSWASIGSSGGGGGGGGGIVTTIYNDFYNLMSQGNLVAGTSYRITDYQSTNYLNGYDTANNNPPPISLPSGARINTYNNPPNPSTINPWGLCVLADGSCIVGTSSGLLIKFDPNGNEIASFTTNTGVGGNGNAIYSIAVQSDGKIIVSGNFNNWNGNVVGGIVRLNPNGTYDATFTTNIGSGFDTTIFSVAVQSDDKIVVGGTFTLLNGNPQNYFARLNSDGTDDAVFNANVMSLGSFNSQVSQIIIEPLGSFLVLGSFNSYNGNPTSQITRLDNLGNSDFIFDANLTFGGGFVGGQPFVMALQNDGSIVLGGSFTGLNFTSSNRIIRLLPDGSEDAVFSFNANTFVGADNNIFQIVVRPSDGNIYFFGTVTSYDTNAVQNAFALDTLGFFNSTLFDGYSSGLSQIPIYTNAVLQPTTENILFCSQSIGNVVSLSTSPMPFTAFDPQQLYTSPNVETIVVKALDTYNIEPIAFSEQYPQDTIYYLPQANNICLYLSIFNGATLPDSSIVAGFDLQWDGTKAYFDMPTGYPVETGQNFYIYCDFSDGRYVDVYTDVINFGFNNVQTQTSVPTTITISNNLTRVYLNDVDFATFSLYVPNTLYVDGQYAFAPMKGWIVNRKDNFGQITYPSDWRNQKYRRYELINSILSQTILWYYPTATFNTNTAYTYLPTGIYDDYKVISSQIYNSGFSINTFNGASGVSYADNNVFLNGVQGISLSGFYKNNTFGSLSNINDAGSITESYISNAFNVVFNGDVQQIISTNQLSNSIFNGFVFSNIIDSTVEECIFYGTFRNNMFISSTVVSSKFGSDFEYNEFNSTDITNAVFGNSTNFNVFTSSPITNWESGLEMTQNTFTNSPQNNTTLGANFYNNTINNSSWQSNIIGSSCSTNIFESPNMFYNVIGKLCTNNTIGSGVTFQYNVIGYGFQSNQLFGLFTQNHIADRFFQNTLSSFYQNVTKLDFGNNDCNPSVISGTTFSMTTTGNIFRGSFSSNIFYILLNNTFQNPAVVQNNIITGLCQNNVFVCAEITNNVIHGQIGNNNIGCNRFVANTIVGNFGGNQIGSSLVGQFTNNIVNSFFENNEFGTGLIRGNRFGGASFTGNESDCNWYENNINSSIDNCTFLAGIGSQFGFNDFALDCLGVNFNLATYVYSSYACKIQAGNTGNRYVIYWDDATTTYLGATPENS